MESARRSYRSLLLVPLGLLALSVVLTAAPSFAAKGDCGQPSSTGATPKSSDSLFALKAAVGTNACDLCVCDVTNDSKITSTDALKILKKGVGQDVTLTCPACVPALTGVVLLPSPLLSPLPAGAGSASLAVGLTGLAPVSGATVELLEIDNEGTPLLPVLATTTSNADGSYRFSPAPEPSSTTIVRTTVAAATLRAFVNGNTVNLDPSSEFVVAAAQEAANSDVTSDLTELSVAEIDSLLGLVRQADVDFSSSPSLADALALLDDSTGGVYRKYVLDFASDTGSNPAMTGDFRLVNLGMVLSRSFVPPTGGSPSVNTRSLHPFATSDPLSVDAEGSVTQAATTGRNHTLVEVSGTDPVDGAINASGTLFHADVNQVPGAATGTLLAADGGRLLLNAQDNVVAGLYAKGSDFAVVPGVYRVNANTGVGGLGVLMRQGAGLSNSSLSGAYWFVQLELNLGAVTTADNVHREVSMLGAVSTATFDGNGNLNITAATGHSILLTKDGPTPAMAAQDPTLELSESDVLEDPVSGLKYTLTSTGALAVKEGAVVVAVGAVTPDRNLVVLRIGDDSAGDAASGLVLGIKRGAGMNNASLAGSFRNMDLSVSLQHSTQPGSVDAFPSSNNRSVGFYGSLGTLDMDGVGGVAVERSVARNVTLQENSGVQLKSVPPDVVFDAETQLHSSTQGEGDGTETHTYSVASNGEVTVDAAQDGGIKGYLSPDGKVFVLPLSESEATSLDIGVLIALREP